MQTALTLAWECHQRWHRHKTSAGARHGPGPQPSISCSPGTPPRRGEDGGHAHSTASGQPAQHGQAGTGRAPRTQCRSLTFTGFGHVALMPMGFRNTHLLPLGDSGFLIYSAQQDSGHTACAAAAEGNRPRSGDLRPISWQPCAERTSTGMEPECPIQKAAEIKIQSQHNESLVCLAKRRAHRKETG